MSFDPKITGFQYEEVRRYEEWAAMEFVVNPNNYSFLELPY
jgi:hypothetical protein